MAAPRASRGAVARVLTAHGLSAIGMSLPWPLLLVAVWEQTHSDLMLGVTGAARMLPYVLLSWAAGRIGDAWPRGRVVRLTLAARILALGAAALALAAGHLAAAVACSAAAVALATPAYPALAAALPDLVGATRRHCDSARVTELLVTIEVASFVVGPALGGLMLVPAVRPWVPITAVALVVLATACMGRVALPSPTAGEQGKAAPVLPEIRRAGVGGTLAIMSLVNFVDAVVALALVPMAEQLWAGTSATYGVATGVLGFGALAGPLLGGLGAGHVARVRTGLVAMALALVTVAPTPALVWALIPLAVIGAVSVHIEAAATSILQEAVPDAVRASVLGLADTTMVGAALLGSLVGPALVELTGPKALFAVVAFAAAGTGLRLNSQRKLVPVNRIR